MAGTKEATDSSTPSLGSLETRLGELTVSLQTRGAIVLVLANGIWKEVWY